MDILARGYNALRGGEKAEQTPHDTISTLVARLGAPSLGDRRAAILSLRALARDFPEEVGGAGFSHILLLLGSDADDADVLKATVDVLNALCSHNPVFVEMFIKDPAPVAILLNLLAQQDFYIRYAVVQFLTTLIGNSPALHSHALNDAIMHAPMGISRLIDLLADKREIIRNEGLLLLIALTRSNADIQKIVAFENAFDKLLDIVTEENSTDGDIIVQDCIQLCVNLLRYNVSNQTLFRESGLLSRIPDLLVSHSLSPTTYSPSTIPITDPSSDWRDQKVRNTIAVLELIRVLCVPGSPGTPSNQNVLTPSSLLPLMLDLSLLPHVPATVRTQALFTLGDIISSNQPGQTAFHLLNVPTESGESMSSLAAIVWTALYVSKGKNLPHLEDIKLRCGASYVIFMYLEGNEASFLSLGDETISLVISALLDQTTSRKDPYQTWFSSAISRAIIRSPNGKTHLLAAHSDVDGISTVLDKIMYNLLTITRSKEYDSRVVVAYLSLLVEWFYDSPEAVKAFLSEGSNLSWVIETTVSFAGDALVMGLSAALLGVCCEFLEPDAGVDGISRSSLSSIITNRIGLDIFISRIDRMRESKEFNDVKPSFGSSGGSLEVGNKGLVELWFEFEFVEFFKGIYDTIKTVTSPRTGNLSHRNHHHHHHHRHTPVPDNGKSESDAAAIADLVAQLAARDEEVSKYQAILSELEMHIEQIPLLHSRVQDLESELDAEKDRYADLEKEQEDLLVCLAEQDLECKSYRRRLKHLGDHIDDDDEADNDDDNESEGDDAIM